MAGVDFFSLKMTSREFYDYRKGLRDKFLVYIQGRGQYNF